MSVLKNRPLPLVLAVLLMAVSAVAEPGSFLPMGGVQVQAQQEATENAKDEAFYMLNAFWFKEDGGAEKYAEYMAAAGPFVAKHGGKGGDAYIPVAAMIGKFDADLVFFVEWPNDKAFTTFLADPGYQAVSHLRGEAIKDSLLIRCKKA